MFKYRATLRSGAVVTRKSDRTYTHYWHVVGINNSAGGFAGSEALAKKAARLYSSYFPNGCETEIVPVEREGKNENRNH
jgi:hypothetical protein